MPSQLKCSRVQGRRDFTGVATATVVVLDPATDPKCLDFKVRPERARGAREGFDLRVGLQARRDMLTWAFYHGRGKNRPTALDKPTDRGVMVMVFKRVKE